MKNSFKLFVIMLFVLSTLLAGSKPECNVNPPDYQFNGCMVAAPVVPAGHRYKNLPGDAFYAYVGEECRGASQALYFKAEKQYVHYLMLYSDVDTIMTMKFYSQWKDSLYTVGEFTYTLDMIDGDPVEPVVFLLPAVLKPPRKPIIKWPWLRKKGVVKIPVKSKP